MELHTSPRKLTSAKIKLHPDEPSHGPTVHYVIFRKKKKNRLSDGFGFKDPRHSETFCRECATSIVERVYFAIFFPTRFGPVYCGPPPVILLLRIPLLYRVRCLRLPTTFLNKTITRDVVKTWTVIIQ